MSAGPHPPVFVPPGAPRSVRFGTYAGMAGTTGLLLGAIFSLVGWGLTLGFVFGGGPFWEDWILDSRGVPATAMPDEAHATNSSVNRSRVWAVSFHFTDADGVPHSGTIRTTDMGVRNAAQEGKTFPIHYVPGNVRLVRADGTKRSVFGFFALIPFLFAAIGTGVLVATARGVLRRRRLYVWGTPTTGRVLSVGPSGITVNNRELLRIRYEFVGPGGPAQGTMTNPTAPPEGAEVTVLYDPSDPTRNVLPVPGSFGV